MGMKSELKKSKDGAREIKQVLDDYLAEHGLTQLKTSKIRKYGWCNPITTTFEVLAYGVAILENTGFNPEEYYRFINFPSVLQGARNKEIKDLGLMPTLEQALEQYKFFDDDVYSGAVSAHSIYFKTSRY